MAGNTTNISIRMDADLKAQADALFNELGMYLTTAFNIFVRQSLREGGIPFEIKLDQPNKETIAAMLEAERIARDPSVKHYSDVRRSTPGAEKMKRDIVWTARFKKDYKLAMKRHMDIGLLDDIIRALSQGEKLPEKNKDHELTGDWVGHRECHILPDWLLIYRIEDDVLVLTLARTGTHSDLFDQRECCRRMGKPVRRFFLCTKGYSQTRRPYRYVGNLHFPIDQTCHQFIRP